MFDIEKLQQSFKDYSKDFKKNRKNAMGMLKELYPIPSNLTDDEKKFFLIWGIDSFPLLSYLRCNDGHFDEYFEKFHYNLNKGISKYDNIKVNSILFRRVFNDFFIVNEGELGIFNTPLSTTFDSNSNLDFGNHLIKILAPIGTNGAYIEELMLNGNYSQHLNEWILPKGTIYKTLYKDYSRKLAIIIIMGDVYNAI